MAEIKAVDVAKLRKMTGAGMMDCKNALTEANGDFDRAQEIIREKGKLIAAKRADRETTEGAVVAKLTADNKSAIMVALGCETDFVAKNDEFKGLANKIAEIALESMPADTNALGTVNAGGFTIEEMVSTQTGKSGEKHIVCFYDKINGEYLSSYIHMNNKLGAVVAFNKTISTEAGKDIAMQVAAMNPVSVDKDDCPQSFIETELNIGREQAKQEGKPEAMIEKIAQGKLNKFFKERTLNEQTFVKDEKLTVSQYLKNVDKDAKITGFIRFSLND